jgi:hypothetical protein
MAEIDTASLQVKSKEEAIEWRVVQNRPHGPGEVKQVMELSPYVVVGDKC